MSFAVHSDITQLSVEARWGNYRKERRKTDEVASVEGLYIEKPDAEFVSVWQRYPMQGSAIVTLAEGDLPPVYPITEAPGVSTSSLRRNTTRTNAGSSRRGWLSPRPTKRPFSSNTAVSTVE